MKMNKQLYLVTETFPYGTGEKSFIIPELEELVKHYDVTIISHAPKAAFEDKKNETKLDSGIKVINIDIDFKWYKKLIYFLRFFIDHDGIKELKYILREKEKILTRIYQSIGFYALALENFKIMKNNDLLDNEKETIYYTYWYFYYTYSATKNRKDFPKTKIVTRTHRFDLYSEQYKGGRQPFKEIMDINLDRIFFISDQGRKYYLEKYHFKNPFKYVVSRIGTVPHSNGVNCVRNGEKNHRVVSCSSVIPLKRVGLIAEALSLLEEPVEWVHFGTGCDYDMVVEKTEKLLKSKTNVTYKFMGLVSNEEIMEYYRTHYVYCFISTSESEGLPVSIQEAMSYGIPIIATDVGGVSELIQNNGVLLNANPTKDEVVRALEKVIEMPKTDYEKLRENSYREWMKDYNAKANRVKFINMLED